jgi:succinyl-CoA synthetase alpha subunit
LLWYARRVFAIFLKHGATFLPTSTKRFNFYFSYFAKALFVDALKYLENDPTTQQIVLLGEIGGELELDAANFINNRMTKPVIAYITGQEAPIRVRMGHAGAVIDSPETTAASKIEALQRAGCKIAQDPFSIVNHLSNITRADEPTL